MWRRPEWRSSSACSPSFSASINCRSPHCLSVSPRSSSCSVRVNRGGKLLEQRRRVVKQTFADEVADGFEDSPAHLLDRQHVAAIAGRIRAADKHLSIPSQSRFVVSATAQDVGFGQFGGQALPECRHIFDEFGETAGVLRRGRRVARRLDRADRGPAGSCRRLDDLAIALLSAERWHCRCAAVISRGSLSC